MGTKYKAKYIHMQIKVFCMNFSQISWFVYFVIRYLSHSKSISFMFLEDKIIYSQFILLFSCIRWDSPWTDSIYIM